MKCKMSRKAQGLPLNTIILALLGLAVMVLIFAAMTGRLGAFTKATTECPGRCTPHDRPLQGYGEYRDQCVPDLEVEQSGSYIQRGTKEGVPKKCESCCLRLF